MKSYFLPLVSCLLLTILPSVLAGFLSRTPSHSPGDVLEICWGDRKLTITPHVLSNLIDYFRVCINSISVLSLEEEPHMLSTLRNKIYNTLPDLNRAFLSNAISYDQVTAMENALHNVEKVMTEKGIATTQGLKDARWLTINKSGADFTNLTDQSEALTSGSDNPCKDLVVLDGVDKDSNQSIKFIPTPYQDDPRQPQYMAVPFTKHFLYDIRRKDSVNVLRRYYVQSVRCLRGYNETDVTRFRHTLYGVIVNKFLPVIREDPYRVIPAYGGVLEILADISNSMQTTNNTQPPEDRPGYGLRNVYFKKMMHLRSIKSDSKRGASTDWVWGKNDNRDSGYYRSLLILLAVILVLNGVCYAATLAFYLLMQRNALKTGTSRTSLLSSKYSGWSAGSNKQTECPCPDTRKQTECPWPDTRKQKEIPCNAPGPREPQTVMIHHVQHIKCPHNVTSPRPEYIPSPHTSRVDSGHMGGNSTTGRYDVSKQEKPLGTKQDKSHKVHTQGQKMYMIKDFSVFKPFRCKGLKSARDTEEAQSIQGMDEFQRIVRELDEVQRSLQHFHQDPKAAQSVPARAKKK